jgi:hypothetical protein
VSIQRTRYALDLPRASTFGAIAKRATTSLTTMDSVTGLTLAARQRDGDDSYLADADIARDTSEELGLNARPGPK